MKLFNAEQTRAALPMAELIEVLRKLFVSGCEVPLRHTHVLPGSVTSLIMPAWLEGRYYGVKIINIGANNAVLGKPGLFAVYTLFDARTGEPLAQLDGNELTAARTAAASALAASYLARADATRLVIVGSGRIASLLALAYAQVRTLSHVYVWSRHFAHAQTLVHKLELSEQLGGVRITATADLEAAVRKADIVTCATLACEPVVQGAWLTAGSHLDLIGSFTPAMREADDACFADAKLFVDTDEAARKSGELLGPLSRGVFKVGDIQASLAQLCKGEHVGRAQYQERTVFKSVGNALEDLGAAILAYEGGGHAN